MHQKKSLSEGCCYVRAEQTNFFLYTLPRTGFNTEVCSYFSLSKLDWHVVADAREDRLTMYRGVKAMPDNGR